MGRVVLNTESHAFVNSVPGRWAAQAFSLLLQSALEYPIVYGLQLPGLAGLIVLCELWLREQLARTYHLVCAPNPSTCHKKGVQPELTASRLPAHLPFLCSWLSGNSLRVYRAVSRGQNSKDLWPPLMVSVIFLQAPSALLGGKVL